MKSTLQPTSFWQRLEQNRTTNGSLFAAAGLRPELAKDVSCPVCGLQENVIFWSCSERGKHFLHLRCPRCMKGSAWYSLKKNAAIESFLKLTQVLCGSAALLLLVTLGSFAYVYSDRMPTRVTTNMVAARDKMVAARYQIDDAADAAMRRLEWTVSAGHERVLLLREIDHFSSPTGRYVFGETVWRVWHNLNPWHQG